MRDTDSNQQPAVYNSADHVPPKLPTQVWQSRSSPAEAFQPRLCAQTGDIFKGFQTFQGRSPTKYQQGHLQGRPADKQ